ncbi:Formate acetyltransferase [Bifidobacterium coryneforme]|uniref:Formate acetyltransferase n=1 Tax=Bifidobacterium coryneforme TaxID=1687 RepID=A0ABD4AD41_9BIFI|nr:MULTISPECIES: formate C-acetyltransferase [Bifidobacterium]AII74592.1 formate acetyltransferase [Bifidobacterium coryneforme]KJY53217.1 Formate acetyltransferase [Bifidobacterium coryneforme]PXY80179.1 formate C-acetyltransferase [Bifidobacterium indicum]
MTAVETTSVSPEELQAKAWDSFKGEDWKKNIDVRDFIQENYTPYTGDESFLAPATEKTKFLWNYLDDNFLAVERKQRIYDVDTHTPAGIDAFPAGYIDGKSADETQDNVIVGLQTDVPCKRAMMPNGGWRMVEQALMEAGKEPDPEVKKIFTRYRKTHNDGVFDVYTRRIKLARHNKILTGLPDAYGRGRIIGDYRRVALYGINELIAQKKADKDSIPYRNDFTEEEIEHWIRFREEHSEQIKALKQLLKLGQEYGLDLSRPAQNAKEAVQWTYMAYLASVKSQDGAAMSIGRLSAFFDIYFERDLQSGLIDETDAQEIVDNIVMKLRIVRFLRTKDYDNIFSGDPYWATWSDAGFGDDGRPLVTKTSFRLLATLTLEHLGPGPEPNITIFWDPKLPEGYKRFCARISIDTSAIQYESDKDIRAHWGDDAAIACCVSPMRVGKQMQFFGARVNSAKALLYAMNGGRDEMTGMQVIDEGVIKPVTPKEDGSLDFQEVKDNYEKALQWLSETYVEALNIIHYMHDKYAYESIEMALHDKEVYRTLGCGMSGLSIAADSLAAIKYAKVYPIYNKDAEGTPEYVEGAADDLIVNYKTVGEFPVYGNDDDRADDLAKWAVSTVMGQIKRLPVYRGAVPTQSILTITSNVEYGKNTGSFPSGHKKGTPYAPGANPENGMDSHGMLPSMFSVGKIDYDDALDGISLTNTITPDGLGRDEDERINNLVGILDAGNGHGLYHANINVLRKEQLEDAVEHPEKYPHLTVRVSGYAVNFVKLTREQQLDVISRTFHQGAVTD